MRAYEQPQQVQKSSKENKRIHMGAPLVLSPTSENTSCTISCIREHPMFATSKVSPSIHSRKVRTVQFSKMLIRILHSKQWQQSNLGKKQWYNRGKKQWCYLNEDNGAIQAKAVMQSGIKAIWMKATLERKLTYLSFERIMPPLNFMQNIQATPCKMQCSSKESY